MLVQYDLIECSCCSENFVVEIKQTQQDREPSKEAIVPREFYKELTRTLTQTLGPVIKRKRIREHLEKHHQCSRDLVQEYISWLEENKQTKGDSFVFPKKAN